MLTDRHIILGEQTGQILPLKETEERVWFSHWTDEYIVKQGTKRQVIEWLEGKPEIKMDWDNCMVDVAGYKGENRLVLVIRSKTPRNSQYMGNIPVQLRYMLEVEFDIKSISAPVLIGITASRPLQGKACRRARVKIHPTGGS
jgi:hypothetical protein